MKERKNMNSNKPIYKIFLVSLIMLAVGVLATYFVFNVDFDTFGEFIFAILVSIIALGLAILGLVGCFWMFIVSRDTKEEGTIEQALIADILRLENPKIGYLRISKLLRSPDTKVRFNQMSEQNLRDYRNRLLQSKRR